MGGIIQPSGSQFLPLDVFNSAVPPSGPKCVPINVAFNITASWSLDLTSLTNQAKMEYVQTAFVDNSQNPAQLVIQNAQSNQRIIIPPNSQAYVPMLQPNPPQLTISSAIAVNLVVPIYFLNFPVAPCVWSASNPAGTFTFTNGNLNVSDVLLDAIISNTGTGNGLNTHPLDLVPLIANLGGGNALAVNVLTGGGGGSAQLYYGANNGGSSTTFTLYTPTSGKSWELSDISLYLDPLANASTSGDVEWTIEDSSTILWSGVVWIPASAPTLTAMTPAALLFRQQGIVKSAAINNPLKVTSSKLLAGNYYYANAAVASV